MKLAATSNESIGLVPKSINKDLD
jgi:hypothetical protein